MVFASLTFLYIFLPLNLILYYISKNDVYRNIVLTLFSFVFYAWGEPFWVLLLIFTAFIDYLNGRFIDRFRHKKWGKLGVVSSICVNVGVLMIFKYSGFVIENVNHVFGTTFHKPGFTFPLGISFYTFQSVSYVFDVYSNKVKAQKSLLKFMMFISLYHQLVAGPIVRYVTIAHEIDNRKQRIADISSGIGRFCIGLFKKVCIANVAYIYVQKYMGDQSIGNIHIFDHLTVTGAWFGLLMYAFQIYFDFSGYSDMAIGLGRMFGFHYLENFNYPYTSRSAMDFWRRWHISLSTWFRDYIYIPLGGNRKNQYFNLFFVWFVTGMWHGASWNFIFWGLMWGILLFIEKIFLGKFLKKVPWYLPIDRIYILFFIMMSWVLFYFIKFNMLGAYLKVLFHVNGHDWWDLPSWLDIQENILWILLALILCTPVYRYSNRWVKQLIVARRQDYVYGLTFVFNFLLLFLSTCLLVGKSYNPFLYGRI
ncbi:MAG: MBOAT family protein [Bacteroidetes bacterium]|nr:MBOAT family protein [Bacteroidota bacterium]